MTPQTRHNGVYVITDEVLHEHASRGVAIWSRVSTPIQAMLHQMSIEFQRTHLAQRLLRLDIPEDRRYVFEAHGESGQNQSRRKHFSALLDLIRDAKIGLIICPEHHRLTRNVARTLELLDLCEQYDVIIEIAGMSMNPSYHAHRMFILNMAMANEHTVLSGREWEMASLLEAAHGLRIPIQLPAGIIWADPTNEEFQKAVRKAGLRNELMRTYETDRSNVVASGKRLRVFSLPDSEVRRSIDLRFRWLLETESLEAVVARIRDGADSWPYPGRVPNRHAQVWSRNLKISWTPVVPVSLRTWFQNPALYGTYRYYVGALAPRPIREARKRRRKGVHFPRLVGTQYSPLPSAEQLVRATDDE